MYHVQPEGIYQKAQQREYRAAQQQSPFQSGRLPADSDVRLGSKTELLTARHVAADSPGLYGGWVIHKEGFRAPKVLELGRLQAWTLKPALPRDW